MGKPIQPRPAETRMLQKLASDIRHHRIARGWTQYQLADKAGIDKATVSVLERGLMTARLRLMLKISSALRVPLGKLCAHIDGGSAKREWQTRRRTSPAVTRRRRR